MDEAVPGNSTNSPFELLQAPNAVVIEATEASKQRYRGLTAGPLMNDTWTSTLALPLVQASQVTLQLQRPRVGLVLLIYQRLLLFRSAASTCSRDNRVLEAGGMNWRARVVR